MTKFSKNILSSKTNRRTRGRIFKKIGFIFLVLLILLVLGGMIFSVKNGFLNIKKTNVKITGADCVSRSAVEQEIIRQNSGFFLFNPNLVTKKLKDKFVCIDNITLAKSFPDKVNVFITGRVPAAVINSISLPESYSQIQIPVATSSSDTPKLDLDINKDIENATSSGRFIVDKKGFIFSDLSSADGSLPEINMAMFDAAVGKMIPDNQIENTLNILNQMQVLEVPVNKVSIIGPKLVLDSQPKLTFSLEKDVSRQLASLQLIWQKAKIIPGLTPADEASKSVESIDLRFDKPVVVYSKKKK